MVLDELTKIDVNGERALRSGFVEADDPDHLMAPLPTYAIEALDDTLRAYQETLVSAPEPGFFKVLDAKRELGVGVSSWARLRVLVLVDGPTSSVYDDVILEVKELMDSGASGAAAPGAYAETLQKRILRAREFCWTRPDADPLWGASTWLGLPVQVRRETEAHESIRVRRLEGDRGGVQALIDLAEALGRRLALVHATEPALAEAIAGRLSQHLDAFVAEQVEVALTYYTQLVADWGHFKEALDSLGPTLGVAPGHDDLAPDEMQLLFGTRWVGEVPTP